MWQDRLVGKAVIRATLALGIQSIIAEQPLQLNGDNRRFMTQPQNNEHDPTKLQTG